MSHEYSEALPSKEEGIATITLNRPETLNAFSPGMEDVAEGMRAFVERRAPIFSGR